MVNRYERVLSGKVNFAGKELLWIEGKAPVKHSALPYPFGDSRVGSTHMMRLRELLINTMKWDQFWFFNAQEVVEDSDWQAVLEWLKDHPYALLVGDAELIKQGGKRQQFDKDAVLKDEAEKKVQVKDWIGPQRYDSQIKIIDQKDRAEQEGINCQVAVHVAIEALGIHLNREERSGELYENYTRFDPTVQALKLGDIVFFYERSAILDARSLHVTICVGKDLAGVPLLLHATNQPIKSRPAAEIIPISQLLTNRQRFCYGAVRLIKDERLRSVSNPLLGEV